MPQSGMADPKQCFRTDGSYNFKQRENWDYRHGYEFMSGMLGEADHKAEKARRKKLGTVDMPAPPIPLDTSMIDTIEKTASHIHSSQEPKVFERLIQERNKGKPGWSFMEEEGEGHDYFEFVKHCLERQVQPRPLAEKARKVQADRNVKQANTKSNAMAAGDVGMAAPVKEAKFMPGELMEVLGLKNKADYNGKIVRIIRYHKDVDRYEAIFEGGRYNTIVVKLREDNLMYTSVTEKEVKANQEAIPEGEIPNGTKVMVHSLQSEGARWMNGQNGVIVQWDKEGERYEVRLENTVGIKKVKPANIKPQLPEGWEEHFDEHLGKHYYLHVKSEKVTWKHPSFANTRASMGKVVEKMDGDLEEFDEETGKRSSKVDKEHTHYTVDDEEEGEGGFNLQALVAKVAEKEEKRLAAEDAGEDVEDSEEDGMHKVVKKRKKHKKSKITVEDVQEKVTQLLDQTMVNRATMKKDFTLLEGNFIALKEMDPVIERLEGSIEMDDEPEEEIMRAAFEVMLGGLDKACKLLDQLLNTKLQLVETNRIVDRIQAPTDSAICHGSNRSQAFWQMEL